MTLHQLVKITSKNFDKFLKDKFKKENKNKDGQKHSVEYGILINANKNSSTGEYLKKLYDEQK